MPSMTRPAGYIGKMHEFCAAAPDRGTGGCVRVSIADFGMAAFTVMFLQYSSFLSAQKQPESR